MIFVQSEGTAARRRAWFYLVDATDGITPETGEAGGQPQVSKNGGSWANTSATLTAVGNGTYYTELTATELDTLGKVFLRYKSANTAEFSMVADVVAINVMDSVRAGLTALPNVASGSAGAIPTVGTGTAQITVSGGAVTVGTNNDKTGYGLSSLESLTQHSGTAQAGGSTSITLAAGASATNDLYKGAVIKVYSGTGAGQTRIITAYNGTTKVATVSRAWATNPDNTSLYAVLSLSVPALNASLEVAASAVNGNVTGSVASVTGAVGSVTGAVGSVTGNVGGNVAGSVGSVTGNVGGNVTGSVGSVASGGITSGSFAAGAINAAAIATDAIGASELAADAVAEIQSGLASQASVDTIDGIVDSILADTNELQTDWADGGRLDLILDARASQASVDTIDGIVDAILVDTAEIGAAGAGLSAIPWNAAWDAEVQSEVADALAVYDPPTHAELIAEIDDVQADIAALNNLSAAQVNAEVDTALADIRLDELLAADSDIDGAAPPAVGSVFHELMSKTTGSFTFDQTTDSLEALADSGGGGPTAAQIADAVWDEILSGHLGAGSTGEALNAAGSAGDPWVTALPGAYGAGSAGFIVGTNLNATVSSRASQASVDTIDGNVDDILADTSVIGTPAGASLAADVAAVQADTDDIQTRLPAALVSGRMASDAVAISGSTTAADNVEANIANLDATVSSRATPAQVNSEVDTALADARLDELLAADSDIDGAAPPAVGSVVHELMSKTAGSFTFDQTTDSLEALRDNQQPAAAAALTAYDPPTHAELVSEINSVQSDIAALNDLSSGDVQTAAAAVLTAYDPPTHAELVSEVNDVQADIAALNDLSAAEVNAEVLDVLGVDVQTEISSIPAAATTLTNMIRTLYAFAANHIRQTNTTQTLRNRADSATISTAPVSDDDITAIRGSHS